MRETRRNGGAGATSELTPLRAPLPMDARLMDNQVAPPGADSPPPPAAVLVPRGSSGASDADEARDSVPPIDLEQFAFHRCVRRLEPAPADALARGTLTEGRRAARSGS